MTKYLARSIIMFLCLIGIIWDIIDYGKTKTYTIDTMHFIAWGIYLLLYWKAGLFDDIRRWFTKEE